MAFLLFCSIWALLNLLYTSLVSWKFADTAIGHPYIVAGVELLTVLFWFAGFIAAAVFLADRVCYGHVCSAAKAATVFGAFEWWVSAPRLFVVGVLTRETGFFLRLRWLLLARGWYEDGERRFPSTVEGHEMEGKHGHEKVCVRWTVYNSM